MSQGRVRRFAGWLLLGSFVGVSAGSVQAADRAPNIVLIVADDLGWGDVGFNGRSEWRTPTLDRLAADGVVLKRCYAAPICGPSRAALLTGKYTIHNGVRRNDQDLPLEEVTIAEALRKSGYQSGLFGKWQHGKPRSGGDHYVHPLDQGFDRFFGFTDSYEALEKFPTQVWRGRDRVPVSGYIDDLITDQAIEYLKQVNRDTPFFLDVSYLAPHFSIAAPGEEIERLKGKVGEADSERFPNTTYAAMITRMDWNIGRLCDTLKRCHLFEETLLVFTSDNGATFEFGNQGASAALDSNRPFRGQKRTLWEGGIRVPGLACWPGKIAAGQVCREVVHLIDLLPTLVAAAGGTVDPAWRVDGVNVLRVLTGKGRMLERTVFWEWQSEGANELAALRGDLKIVISRGGKPELYDVSADPAERRDLSATHPQTVQQLQSEIEAWMATEDPRGKE